MAAWIPSAVAGLLFANYPPLIEGPFRNAAGGVDVSLPVALGLAAVIYLALLFALPGAALRLRRRRPAAVPAADGEMPAVVEDPSASAHRQIRATASDPSEPVEGPPDGLEPDLPRTSTAGAWARSTPPSSPGSRARRPSPGCPGSTRSPTCDVAVVGVPFDAGVSYRPGARFGPAHVRESSRLLRPYNPARRRRAVRPPAGRRRRRHRREPLLHRGGDRPDRGRGPRRCSSAPTGCSRIGGDHTVALPLLRAIAAEHGPVAVVHFDAHLDTWDTYFGAAYTHGTPFRRASEEGLLDRSACLHVGTRGPLYSTQDLVDDRRARLPVVPSTEIDDLGATRGRRAHPGARGGPAGLRLGRHRRPRPGLRARAPARPEAGGMTSRELLAVLRELAGLDIVGADIVEVAPAYDHAEITGIAASHDGLRAGQRDGPGRAAS